MLLHVLVFYLLDHYLSKRKSLCKESCKINVAIQRNARFLTLNQKTAASHFRRLLQAHSLEDRRGDITKDAIGLCQAPALGCVGHDEGDLVGSVRGLGLAIGKLHLLGISR